MRLTARKIIALLLLLAAD